MPNGAKVLLNDVEIVEFVWAAVDPRYTYLAFQCAECCESLRLSVK